MNNVIFRDIEFWKSAVMTMPDNSFFELMRSVFGKIKTPFNKQQLLKDLEAFLLRDDIQNAIAAYIDENDVKIIAAVALFGEPLPEELDGFFSGEMSYVQLHDLIVNLEERFILYRFKGEDKRKIQGKNRLALNPVLKQVLLPYTENASLFLNDETKTETPHVGVQGTAQTAAPNIVVNEIVLAGFLSFVSQWETFFRTEGGSPRKQIMEAGKTIFPGIDLEEVVGCLQVLGLFYVDVDKVIPDKKYFNDFALLSKRERSEYLAAALFVYSEIKLKPGFATSEILPPLYRSRVRETVTFIHGFMDSLDTELAYTQKTLKRTVEILKARTETMIESDKLLEVIEKTGLIATTLSGLKQAVSFAHNKTDTPSIAIDSGVSVIVYPETDFADAVKLAEFLNIKESGAVVRFELEKESAVRAFDNNITAGEIIDLLNRLSGGRVDDNLVWNLKDWETRHKEVSLKKGVVLTLAQDKQCLAETNPLNPLILETLAPGVYLLDENAMQDAATALQNAGVDIIARRQNKKENTASTYNYFPSLSNNVLYNTFSDTSNKVSSDVSDSPLRETDAATLITEFHGILENMKLAKTESSELSARINRRLVLCDAQLKDASVRYEKLEARHLDYAGKQQIAKQAVTQQSPVEVVTKGKRIFGVPSALEKEGGELILVFTVEDLTGMTKEEQRIPLAKISLLRRIKKSIFE
ncbi:MAG: hypothetical protein LBU66_00125 [Treponema sp.]|jgi:hypothetical protein|nr:hypothetical protein [Treponema sp.]